MSKKKGKLFVISGPSGVGKDTLVSEYLKENNAYLSVSATTRKPRKNEINGKDYYFISENEFKEKIDNDDFLEYAKYNKCYYGTLKSNTYEYLNKGIDVFLIIEVVGAKKVKKQMPDSVLIFIMPPNLEILKNRIEQRALDSKENIENRLKIAIDEINESKNYDYVLVNNDLDIAIEKFKLIIDEEKGK